MSREPQDKWISLEKACKIEGSDTPAKMRDWLRRWNGRTDTTNKVRRRHGKVEEHSLRAAMAEDENRFSEKDRAVESAYMALASGKPRRSTANARKGELRA